MEINDFITSLKNKYNYSDEMVSLLQKTIPALITYYGEDKKNIIYGALNDCEIHIQKENENAEEYLNQYFGTDKKWDIPFLGGAFQDTELFVKDNRVHSKSIIFIKTEFLRRYKPFDFGDDEKVSSIIHELCHAIKGYGRIKVENGQVITQTGLMTDIHPYNPNTNSFEDAISSNTGLEEALNSYDEAEIMSIITGVPHEFGAYKGMTQIARMLMEHKELADVIKRCQFNGSDEWKEFLGKENADLLIQNFEDWVNVLYSSPAELMNDKLGLMAKMETAMNNLATFAKSYSTPTEVAEFKQARTIADQKTIQMIQQTIMYNSQTNQFEQIEQIEQSYRKSL